MRIDTYLYLSQLLKDDNIKFTEGSLISGKIKEIEGKTAHIVIKGFGAIKAIVEGDVKELVGKDVTFTVKSVKPDKVELKIVIDTNLKDSLYLEKEGKEYLRSILNQFNIKDDDTSIKLLDAFLKYNIKINRDNLNNGINILDKLNQILNLEEGETIVPIDSNRISIPLENQDIRNLLVVKDDANGIIDQSVDTLDTLDVNIDINKNTNAFKGLDIKDFFIKNIDNMDFDIVKAVAFFIKHNIKPTLNNIKFLAELNENLELFSKDYEILKNYFHNEFTNFHKNIIIRNGTLDALSEEVKEEYIQWLDRQIASFEKKIANGDERAKKALKEYADKVEFLKEMNKDLVFIYLPFAVGKNYDEGIITFLKNRKRKNKYDQKVNIYINLNTGNFGKLKIICQVYNLKIDVKFNNLRDKDVDFFKSKEEELKQLVNSTGYEINSITYNMKDSQKILDTLIENPNPTYYLNVKV